MLCGHELLRTFALMNVVEFPYTSAQGPIAAAWKYLIKIVTPDMARVLHWISVAPAAPACAKKSLRI